VSFIPPLRILGRKYHRKWSPPICLSQRINPRRMCTRRRMWRTASNWRCRWRTSSPRLARPSRKCGSERISCVVVIGSTALSWVHGGSTRHVGARCGDLHRFRDLSRARLRCGLPPMGTDQGVTSVVHGRPMLRAWTCRRSWGRVRECPEVTFSSTRPSDLTSW
jgi:hypothetical protein